MPRQRYAARQASAGPSPLRRSRSTPIRSPMPSATTMAMTSGPQLVLKKSIMDAEPRHAVLAVHRSGLPPDRARFQGDRESSQRCSPMTRVQSSASNIGTTIAALRAASLSKVPATRIAGTTTTQAVTIAVISAERLRDPRTLLRAISNGANKTASVVDQTRAPTKGFTMNAQTEMPNTMTTARAVGASLRSGNCGA